MVTEHASHGLCTVVTVAGAADCHFRYGCGAASTCLGAAAIATYLLPWWCVLQHFVLARSHAMQLFGMFDSRVCICPALATVLMPSLMLQASSSQLSGAATSTAAAAAAATMAALQTARVMTAARCHAPSAGAAVAASVMLSSAAIALAAATAIAIATRASNSRRQLLQVGPQVSSLGLQQLQQQPPQQTCPQKLTHLSRRCSR